MVVLFLNLVKDIISYRLVAGSIVLRFIRQSNERCAPTIEFASPIILYFCTSNFLFFCSVV